MRNTEIIIYLEGLGYLRYVDVEHYYGDGKGFGYMYRFGYPIGPNRNRNGKGKGDGYGYEVGNGCRLGLGHNRDDYATLDEYGDICIHDQPEDGYMEEDIGMKTKDEQEEVDEGEEEDEDEDE